MAQHRRLLGAAALAAALAGGGVVGATLGAPTTSGAVTAPADDTAPTDDTTTGDPCGPGVVLHRTGGGVDLGVAAGVLDITEDELRAALQDDRTIADVADERGVDVQAVVDALVGTGPTTSAPPSRSG